MENGFKETEIGEIPMDWDVVRLGEMGVEFFGGGTPSTKKPEYWNGDIPWTTSAYINGLYLQKGTKKITHEGLSNSTSRLVPKNNLLIGTRVGVGKVAVNLIDVAISQDLTGMIVDTERANLKFLALAISSDIIQEIFRSCTRGTTIKGIPRDDLIEIPIPLPPLPEQQKIAQVLSTIQQAIEQQDKIIASVRELKKSLMRKLFTEGLGDAELKETEIGTMPKHWDVVRLGEMGKVVTGTTPRTKNKEYYNGNYMFISPGDLGEFKYVYKTAKLLTEDGLKVSRILPKNSLLVTCIGSTIGKTGMTFSEQSATNQQINAVVCNSGVEPHFLYYLLTFKSDYVKGFATKGPVPILSKSNFEKLYIPRGPFPEQQKIARILSTVDKKIEVEENRKGLLQELFKTMLQKLMTGHIRVKDLEV